MANKVEYNNGSIVVAGGTQINATKWEYAVASFSATTGAFQGVKTTSSSGTGIDQINDLCTDNAGNIYVTGGIVNSGSGYDYQTVKLNDSLDVQWAVAYNGTDNLDGMGRSSRLIPVEMFT